MVNLWHRACCWGESWQKSHCRPPTIPSCILLYIHFPPFSTYACTLSICFYFSHFLCIQILIKATIFILPLSLILPLATLSSSCYLLSCTQKTCFFFFSFSPPQDLSPPRFFFLNGTNSLPPCIIIMLSPYSGCISRLLCSPRSSLLKIPIPSFYLFYDDLSLVITEFPVLHWWHIFRKKYRRHLKM